MASRSTTRPSPGRSGAVRDAAEGLALPEGDEVTQFEALTAAAFWTFREAGAAACVVEAGLGGRYDATNVLQPGRPWR